MQLNGKTMKNYGQNGTLYIRIVLSAQPLNMQEIPLKADFFKKLFNFLISDIFSTFVYLEPHDVS